MRLKYRNCNKYETFEIDESTKDWINVTCPEPEEEPPARDDGLPLTEEDYVNWRWEVAMNREEYNSWHSFSRHTDGMDFQKRITSRKREFKEAEDRLKESASVSDCTEEVQNMIEMEQICSLIKEVLAKKPDWADMFICIRIKDEKIRDYARRNGLSENNVTQKLERARRKLEKYFKNRKILHDLVANYRGTSSERRSSDEKQ